MACVLIARRTAISKPTWAGKRQRDKISRVLKKAAAGTLVLLSQDEARFSMIPTLRTTLGLKGHRPIVGNLDCHDVVYVFGALNMVTGQLTTRLVERYKASERGQRSPSRQRRSQAAFARHVRDIARAYPAARYPRVVLVIDNAPWHQGAPVTAALKAVPHVEFYRLPSYSPQLQVIERLWKVLRRRATHNRLFPRMAQLRQALRNSLCYYQTLKHRVLSLIQAPQKRTKLPTA
jgi:DDE superfamily endonuclease